VPFVSLAFIPEVNPRLDIATLGGLLIPSGTFKTYPESKKEIYFVPQERNHGKFTATTIFLSLNSGRLSISFPSWYNATICAETFPVLARLNIRTINKTL